MLGRRGEMRRSAVEVSWRIRRITVDKALTLPQLQRSLVRRFMITVRSSVAQELICRTAVDDGGCEP